MTTLRLRKSIGRSPLALGFLLTTLVFALASFPFSPTARASTFCQDGCDSIAEETFLGNDALISVTTANRNTAIGFHALRLDGTGFENTAIGRAALNVNTSGFENTAVGADALFSNTTGSLNTANGFFALFSNTTGSNNTAIGASALQSNTAGSDLTAVGYQALLQNTTGAGNTAIGFNALYTNTEGRANTATGTEALLSNTTGALNTATGVDALELNTTGALNTATGFDALAFNVTGGANTATGYAALLSNSGDYNTATGYAALLNNSGDNNTATGSQALFNNTSGSSNIALGFEAGINQTMGSNNIYIGSPGTVSEHRTIRIGDPSTHGRTFIAGISGVTVAGGVGVIVDTNGQLGTVVSSKRFKETIKPMDEASETILALKPVTFRYKPELDPKGVPQFGLVAEDVEKVNPDLVARDDDGKPYSVRYEAVNAMLLNEFLKEHCKVVELEATITHLKSSASKQEATSAKQQNQIEALTAGLQKVSAQVEMSKPAPQVVLNNQ